MEKVETMETATDRARMLLTSLEEIVLKRADPGFVGGPDKYARISCESATPAALSGGRIFLQADTGETSKEPLSVSLLSRRVHNHQVRAAAPFWWPLAGSRIWWFLAGDGRNCHTWCVILDLIWIDLTIFAVNAEVIHKERQNHLILNGYKYVTFE
jgi:hypothetical protein